MTTVRHLLVIGLAAAGPAATAAPPAFTAHRVSDERPVPPTANRGYQLLVPAAAAGQTYPLVVYLHGAGAKGTDTPAPAAEVLPMLLAAPATQARFPCFVLAPQCRAGTDALGRPNNWVKWVGQKDHPPAQWVTAEPEPSDQLRAAMLALDDVLAKHPIDRRRVYLAGVSMGGSGSWYWAAREPDRFAAVLTACGLSEPAKAGHLKSVPVWAFHGSDDDVAPVARSREMIAGLKKAGGTPRYTEFTGAGHNIAARVLTDDDHAALKWLFAQARPEKK